MDLCKTSTLSTLFYVLMAIFPGEPGLAGTRMSPFWILLELRMMQVVVTTGAISRAKLQLIQHQQQTNTRFLQAGCLSCHLTNIVKAKAKKEAKFTILH